MLTEYIQAAMRHATYEVLPEDGSIYGEISEIPGVWANADTPDETRAELQEVLEEWIALALSRHIDIPVVDGLAVYVRSSA